MDRNCRYSRGPCGQVWIYYGAVLKEMQGQGKLLFSHEKDLDGHLTTDCPNRAHKCEYCGEEGTYASITEEHDQLCLKKPISCPNTEMAVFIPLNSYVWGKLRWQATQRADARYISSGLHEGFGFTFPLQATDLQLHCGILPPSHWDMKLGSVNRDKSYSMYHECPNHIWTVGTIQPPKPTLHIN